MLKRILLICLIFLFTITPVFANSAQTWWEGVSSNGTIITDEDCPIIVKHENLTFNIQDFPQDYYKDINEYLDYNASVTAEYEFYNPADYTVSARLVFPFGTTADYGDIYNHETDERYINEDTFKYDITINNKPIDKKLRHTFKYYYDEFNLEEDLPKLVDGFKEDDFFYPELSVTKQIYKISNVDNEKYDAAHASFSLSANIDDTKILMPDASSYGWDEETVRIGIWAENGMEFLVYQIGHKIDSLEFKVYENGALEKAIDGNIDLIQEETMTFKDLVFTHYNPIALDYDWYNAMIDLMNYYSESTKIWIPNEFQLDFSNHLLRWYDYTITIEPKGSIINTVTAPLYPSINSEYEPPVYQYTYLLSPAKTWKEFNTLDITINTSYVILENSLNGFEKTDYGYYASFEQLPEEELIFELCEIENPKKNSYNNRVTLNYIFTLSLFFIVPLLIIVIIVAGIIYLVKKSKKYH